MSSTAKSPGKGVSALDIEKRDAYAALRVRDFRLFLSGHLLSVLGVQMQTLAAGYQLYEKTNSKLALGMVGLVQIVPMLGFALPAGQAADRFDRRKTLMSATTLAMIAASGLAAVSMWAGANVPLIYACLFLSGLARAFQGPARSSLMPQLVPYQIFSNAVSWNVSGFELSSMVGPALAGWLIYLLGGVTPVYVFAGLGSVIYFVMLATLTKRSYAAESRATQTDLKTLVAGFEYVWNTKLLLAAMSLDMFAVLLGGAAALLPVYAKDILRVGPAGLGALQAAPSLGAITMALLTTHLPPLKRAGRTLLWAVAGFGLATIVFGLSRNFWLAQAMLLLTGAFDNISVVVRHTLATILTPDEMRGRVSAVNGMFISASNELGRFESGTVAALFGPIFSVVSGGVGTLIVVVMVALSSPHLRLFGRLDERPQNSESE
ncbi:MAG TPA: MFS transporter [Blastocatellia bacterium]|nr:MFS transporter [Blastocatellia bacterium]